MEKTFGSFKLDLNLPELQPLNCPTEPLPHTLEMIDLGPLGIVAADDCGIENIAVMVPPARSMPKSTRGLTRIMVSCCVQPFGDGLRPGLF